ncbi:MAG: ABC transporter ATP-binding protein [Actinomycetota bacterium]|nr:ABC transporter ATP-binding protein [Actinomycetota bacterium]MDQ2955546.1 ABC transporter ATP-binding protein [Actinomycetota bacterium]
MTESSELLRIRNLQVAVPVEGVPAQILRDVSLAVHAGEAVGLVGESGSGKSMTAAAIMRLLPPKSTVGGEIHFDGRSVLGFNARQLRHYRSSCVGMISQDPRATINPVRSVGDFLTEALVVNQGRRRRDATAIVIDLLHEVGVDDAARRLRQYPHELSGGLLQRVAIAAAVAAEPTLLIADEPTTALDVTTQAEVMRILGDLREARGLALLFITHNLDLAAIACDRIAVMYAGSLVEDQTAQRLYTRPRHPYSAALLRSRPALGGRVHRLPAIAGRPVSAFESGPGCAFAPRCQHAQSRCETVRPELVDRDGGRVACLRIDEVQPEPTVSCGARDA